MVMNTFMFCNQIHIQRDITTGSLAHKMQPNSVPVWSPAAKGWKSRFTPTALIAAP